MADYSEFEDDGGGNYSEFEQEAPEEAAAHRDDFGEGAGRSFIEGAADAIPGTSQVGAAMRSLPAVGDVIDDPLNGKKYVRVVDAYRQAKSKQEARSRKAQDDHPWWYLAGNAPFAAMTAAATAGIGGAARAAAPVGTAAIDAVATSTAQGANTGDTRPGAIAVNSAGGHMLAAGAKTVLAPIRWISDVLQVPQQSAEFLFEKFGATKLAKMIAGKVDTPEGMLLSKRVKDLQNGIKDAGEWQGSTRNTLALEQGPASQRDTERLGVELARAVDRGDATMGPGTSFTATPAAGIENDLQTLNRNSLDRAADDSLGVGAGSHSTPFTKTEHDAAMLTKKSEAPLEYRPLDLSYKPRTKPVADPNLEPSGAEWDTQDWRDGMAGSADKRLGMRDDPHWAQRDNDSGVYAQETERLRSQVADRKELADKAAALRGRIAEGSKMAHANRTESMEKVFSEATKYQQKIQAAKAEQAMVDSGNLMERQRLDGVIKQAQTELDNIQRGRAVFDDITSAGIQVGPVKAKMKSLAPVTGAISLAGAAGQMLDNSKIASIAAKAQEWATRDDNLGRAARWALSADGETALTRMMTLANLPEAQETGIEQ